MKNIIRLGLLLSLLLSQRLVFAQDPQVIRLGQAMTTAGDMIINNTRAQAARLPIGTAGQVLVVGASGIPEWGTSGSILTNPIIVGNATFSTAAAKIIPGATSLTFRNNADSADNLSITDAGIVSLRNNLSVDGNILFTGTQELKHSLSGATNTQYTNISAGTSNSVAESAYIQLASTQAGGDLSLGTGTAGTVDIYNPTGVLTWSIGTALTQNATNGGSLVLPRIDGGVAKQVLIGQAASNGDVDSILAALTGTFSSSAHAFAFTQGSANNVGVRQAFFKSRSTDGSANTIVTNGDGVGDFVFYGANGSDFNTLAQILVTVDGVPAGTGTDMPGAIDFRTAADGTSTLASALKLGNDKAAQFTGTIRSSATADLGWSVVNVANQACNTTCTSACVVGIDTLGTGGFLGCAVATADSCICAGAS